MSDETEGLEEEKGGGGAMSLERALSAVRKRLKIVIAMPVLLACLAAVTVVTMPNRFDASALVQIDPRHKLVSNLDTVVTDLKGDFPTVESEVEIIRSRPVILSVIETLGLRNDPEFNRKSQGSRAFCPRLASARPKTTRCSPSGRFRQPATRSPRS